MTKIKLFIKHSKFTYFIYYYFGSAIFRLLSYFIVSDRRTILFVCYGGKKYDDSPRFIHEEMIKDTRFSDFNIVWAFQNPEDFPYVHCKKIKQDSIEYFITALKACCWITNSSVERGLSFKSKKTFYYNSWHGTPIKKMGIDFHNRFNKINFHSNSNIDLFSAQSEYEIDIYSHAYNLSKSRFALTGLPRNDELYSATNKKKHEIRSKLGILGSKTVILYAPTFREYSFDRSYRNIFRASIDFGKWQQVLGPDYIVLFRAHYEVGNLRSISLSNNFVLNVTDYPSINELMIASDILISDYSSIFFDYSILKRPMICYTFDYDEYENKHGLYFDIRKLIPGGSISEDDLLDLIRSINNKEYGNISKSFNRKFIRGSSQASKKVLDLIYHKIKDNSMDKINSCPVSKRIE